MTTHVAAPFRRGLLSISAAAIAWGAGGAVAAELFRTSGLGPIAVSFWRFAIAAAILTPLQTRQHGRPALLRRTSLLTGIALALYQTAYFAAVQDAGLALGTLVTLGAGPVLVSAGAHYLLDEPLTGRAGAAIGIALIGLLLLLAGPDSGPRPLLGVSLALLSALGYSAVTLWARRARATSAGADTWAAGGLCLLPFALAQGLWPHANHAAQSTGWLVFLGIVSTLLAYRWYFNGLTTVPGTTASVLVLLEPATAALLAVSLFGEHLDPTILIGSTLLLTAIVILTRAQS